MRPHLRGVVRGILLAVLLASVGAARADWFVQVAVLADSSFLRDIAESIRKAGFPVTTEPLPRADGPALTRLLVGPYETKAEAQTAARKLAVMGWPGYLRQRTEARKPTPPPATPPPSPAPVTPPPKPSRPAA